MSAMASSAARARPDSTTSDTKIPSVAAIGEEVRYGVAE